jgi:hypothetical protein
VQAGSVLGNVKGTIPAWEMAGQLLTWTRLWKTISGFYAITEAPSIYPTVESMC